MLFEESYEVCTHWGWFRLDRGAYEDYLAGKLWITWIPGKPKEQAAEQRKEDVLPPNVTDAAIRLRDLASRHGAYATFQSAFPGVAVEIPFKQRMKDKLIDELALSVRSSNGLMRANAAHLAAYGTCCHERRAFDQLEILEQRAKRKSRDASSTDVIFLYHRGNKLHTGS